MEAWYTELGVDSGCDHRLISQHIQKVHRVLGGMLADGSDAADNARLRVRVCAWSSSPSSGIFGAVLFSLV